MLGNLSDSTNRSPLWEVGYDTRTELYTFIRQLAWYRWWMRLGVEDFKGEHPEPCLFLAGTGAPSPCCALTNCCRRCCCCC